METTEVQRAYEALLAHAKDGRALNDSPNQERRLHPRFQVHTADLWIDNVAEFTVRDVSAAGIGLAADFPLAEGEHIRVRLREDVSAEAVVVRCQLVESASQYWAPLFHISCRFAELFAGTALVVGTQR